jgi:hypothetical protein
VNKLAKSEAELGELVIREMRKQPGCETLAAIRIVRDTPGWFIAPHDPTAQFSEPAQRAAIAVQIALQKKYVVRSD